MASSSAGLAGHAHAASQPPLPFFLQTFSEQIERAYLRYRARSTIQKQYKQLLHGADPDSLPPLGRKRVKRGEDANGEPSASTSTGAAGAAGNAATAVNGDATTKEGSNEHAHAHADAEEQQPPHIDDVYRLDLSVAKPDAGILAVGDPPNDVYLPSTLGADANLENRQVIQVLLDKTWESDTLFYDLDGLTHSQIKSLAEIEWARELPAPASSMLQPTSSNSGKMQNHPPLKRKTTAAMLDDENDLDEEIEHIKRSFCDKNRASALAARSPAVAW